MAQRGFDAPSVLVVEQDAEARRQMATWLMDAGYTVLTCPGPKGPEYTCLGGRGLPCPLANTADTIVLDLRLESDIVMVGTAGWQLLLYYMDRGRRLVVLGGKEDAVHPLDDEAVTVIRRPADRDTLLAAVAGTQEPRSA